MRVRYIFSGQVCWLCPWHPHPLASEMGPEDWEILTISFRRRDLGEGSPLRAFLEKLFRKLGVRFLPSPPRIFPPPSIAAWLGMDEVEYLFLASHRELRPERYPPDTLPEGAWWTVHPGSVENPGCPVRTAMPGAWQDVECHVPRWMADLILGALDDWNRGASGEDLLR